MCYAIVGDYYDITTGACSDKSRAEGSKYSKEKAHPNTSVNSEVNVLLISLCSLVEAQLLVCIQDLAARNIIVDDNLTCKISAIDRCEDLDNPEPFARVYTIYVRLLNSGAQPRFQSWRSNSLV